MLQISVYGTEILTCIYGICGERTPSYKSGTIKILLKSVKFLMTHL